MNKIFAIAWKDTLVRFASRAELLFFIILPVVFTFILSGGTPSGSTDNRVRLPVVDEAQTELTAGILSELSASSAVRPEVLSRAEAQKQFDAREAAAVLILPAGLDLTALRDGGGEVELLQQPNDLDATIAERAVSTAIRRVSAAVSAAQTAVKAREAKQAFASEEEKQAFFADALETAQSIQRDAPERVSVREAATPDSVDYDPRANSSAGQMITWVFIPLFGISAMFAYERQQGTLRRLLTTPARKATFLLGTIAGQVAMALVQMLLLVGFGILVMRLNWAREPLALFVLLFCAALAGAAIGSALGAFVKTESQANGLSIMFGMVFALMGGCWYPLELFPPAVQTAVRVFPTTWAMQGMLDLGLRGGGLVDILPEAGVLLLFALLFFSLGVARFRYE